MKRSTFSILAVFTTAACGPAVSLGELNQELAAKSTQEALDNVGYYRPLCDQNGYPLVGNINGKAVTTASQFCAAVRDREHKP